MESIVENADILGKKKATEILPIYRKRLLGQGQLFNDQENDLLKDRRWGLWSTLGFSAIICALYILLSGLVVGLLYGLELVVNPDLDQNAFSESLLTNGFYWSISILVTTWSTVGLVILFVALRKGITIQEYLDFNSVSSAVVLRWFGVTLLFILVWDASYSIFGITEPDIEVEAYRNAGNIFLFWIAVVIAAPLSEEFFFRGFIFEGIRGSKLGPVGAILITSVAWGMIHQQYGIYEMVLISVLGVLFGIAKIKTRSLYTTIALHSIFNLISMAEIAAIS